MLTLVKAVGIASVFPAVLAEAMHATAVTLFTAFGVAVIGAGGAYVTARFSRKLTAISVNVDGQLTNALGEITQKNAELIARLDAQIAVEREERLAPGPDSAP